MLTAGILRDEPGKPRQMASEGASEGLSGHTCAKPAAAAAVRSGLREYEGQRPPGILSSLFKVF